MYYAGIYTEELSKTRRASLSVVDVPDEVGTGHLPNESQKH
jgi:hypothetical protein